MPVGVWREKRSWRKEERQPDGKKEGKGKKERGKRERLKGDIKQIR